MLDIEGAFKRYMESLEWHEPASTVYGQNDVKMLVEGNLRGFCIMLELEMKKDEKPIPIVTTVETNKLVEEAKQEVKVDTQFITTSFTYFINRLKQVGVKRVLISEPFGSGIGKERPLVLSALATFGLDELIIFRYDEILPTQGYQMNREYFKHYLIEQGFSVDPGCWDPPAARRYHEFWLKVVGQKNGEKLFPKG